MLADAGLEYVDRGTAKVVNEWPDLDLAVRALASAGPSWPALQEAGHERFADAMVSVSGSSPSSAGSWGGLQASETAHDPAEPRRTPEAPGRARAQAAECATRLSDGSRRGSLPRAGVGLSVSASGGHGAPPRREACAGADRGHQVGAPVIAGHRARADPTRVNTIASAAVGLPTPRMTVSQRGECVCSAVRGSVEVSSSIRTRTRSWMASRMGRTASMPWPAGSASCQSR